MKIVGAIPVHFGREYIAWAVKGLACLDEVHVFHAPEPSYGFAVEGAVCPDSREILEEQALRFIDKHRLHWHTVTGTSAEHQHRMLMHETVKARGATVYVLADADEVWDPHTALQTSKRIVDANRAGRWLTRFCHFWRSFKYVVRDSFRPIRIVDVRHPLDVDAYTNANDEEGDALQTYPVFHFGYAQTIATMRYKLTCHSHSSELRQRPDWLDETFIPWRWGSDDVDLHPVMTGSFWKVEEVDRGLVPRIEMLLGDHPFFSLDLIE